MSLPLPHEGVFVRLGRSEIHGIGVFACCHVLAGTNVFTGDETEIRWVPSAVLDDPSLDDFQRSFYRDFAIRRGEELGCPLNFNLLTAGWYVNEPGAGDEPNLVPSAEFNLIAVRDIEAGEELTVRYADFVQIASATCS